MNQQFLTQVLCFVPKTSCLLLAISLAALDLAGAGVQSAPGGLTPVGGVPGAAITWLAPILAQATLDEPLRRFLEFITKVLLLIGLALVVFSGWLIGQGKTDNAVLCIVGGFVIAAAVPIMRMLAEMTGTTF